MDSGHSGRTTIRAMRSHRSAQDRNAGSQSAMSRAVGICSGGHVLPSCALAHSDRASARRIESQSVRFAPLERIAIAVSPIGLGCGFGLSRGLDRARAPSFMNQHSFG